MEKLIIPCPMQHYDIIGTFSKLKKIDWKQSLKVLRSKGLKGSLQGPRKARDLVD